MSLKQIQQPTIRRPIVILASIILWLPFTIVFAVTGVLDGNAEYWKDCASAWRGPTKRKGY